jgi:GTP cyclohydrolase I
LANTKEEALELLTKAGELILEAVPEKFFDKEHMGETPARYARGMLEFMSGYWADEKPFIKTFKGKKHDSIVIVRNIEFYSMCPHHLIPVQGKADVGYLMGEKEGRIMGLSKMARLVDWATRRFITQEEATELVANTISESDLKPRGVGVRMRAKHFCMCSRGVMKQESYAVTSALLGDFRDIVTRDEWFELLRQEQ